MKQDAVCVAYVHSNEVTHSFSDSLQQLLFFDAGSKGRIMEGGYIKMRCGTDGLAEARNKTVAGFLEQDTADWLLWIDSDMGFKPDSLDWLIKAADPVARPIVGGLCFAQKETALDGYGGFRCSARVTIFDWITLNEGELPQFTGRSWYPPDALVHCAGTGSAFIVIHRSVFEKIAAEYGDTWYDRIRGDDGLWIGEDISFCVRANALGFPVHVDTRVKTTHQKTMWLGEPDFWDQQAVPPADECVAVLVDDWVNGNPLDTSLRASTGLAELWEAEQWPLTKHPWVFIASQATVFGPGWFDHALHAARSGGAHVVGTGGGILIRRTYIDEYGASWDGPGSLLHDGYNGVGALNEIIEAAKQRGVYVTALASRVSVENPPVSDKKDERLFEARRRKFAKVAA